MFIPKLYSQLFVFALLLTTFLISGCGGIVKTKNETATLLKTEDATKEKLIEEINRFAKVNSLRAKMDLKFEDNSFAQFGSKEVYRSADGEVVVQRPANIFLKVQVPILKTDVAQMTSDGEKFRVAILQDNSGGQFKKFIIGTNDADYSKLQTNLSEMNLNNGKKVEKSVNAFANLRPQHFTDAMLVRPIDPSDIYLQSSIFQEENDSSQNAKSPLRRVMRGYYFLDEFKNVNGNQIISRRFWFDRVGGIRLARQQIFDAKGEIESDIVYGREGNLSADPAYARLPWRIEVTRPKEKYKMSLTYQTPETVDIGKTYPATAFVLENSWNLPEVNLDKNVMQVNRVQSAASANTVK